jgi:hypothetical protein
LRSLISVNEPTTSPGLPDITYHDAGCHASRCIAAAIFKPVFVRPFAFENNMARLEKIFFVAPDEYAQTRNSDPHDARVIPENTARITADISHFEVAGRHTAVDDGRRVFDQIAQRRNCRSV